MDVFDEFEMKPLTEGLGFHNKKTETDPMGEASDILKPAPKSIHAQSTNVQRKSIDRATEALDKLMNSLNTLDKQGITFTDTLPVKEPSVSKNSVNTAATAIEAFKQPSIHPVVPTTPELPVVESPVVDSIKEEVKNSVAIGSLGAGTRRGASDSFMGKLKATAVSIPAAILDSIVIFALSILFVMGLLLATEISINTLITSVTTDFMTQVSAGMLYIIALQVYVVLSRSFFGSTLGEWTFDCQMGTDVQVNKDYYPLQVIWRSILVIGTGLIVLPVLSFISRRDLSSYLTGLQLYKKI